MKKTKHKKVKDKSKVKARRVWTRNPATQIKPNDKIYSRKKKITDDDFDCPNQ